MKKYPKGADAFWSIHHRGQAWYEKEIAEKYTEESYKELLAARNDLADTYGFDAPTSALGDFKSFQEQLYDVASDEFSQVRSEIETDARENPAGPTLEDYEKVMANYDEFQVLDVEIHEPYDYNGEWRYDASAYFDIEQQVEDYKEQRLVWKVPEDDIDTDVLREALDNALNSSSIWPNEINEGEPFSFYVDIDSAYGSPDDFESWLDNISYYDGKLADPEDFRWNLMKELGEVGYVGRNEKEEEYWPDEKEKEKQIDLPGVQEIFNRWRQFLK